MAFSTRQDLDDLISSGHWAEFKQKVYEEMRERGVGLDDVWFEARGRRAYALIHTDEAKAADVADLASDWGADDVELFTVEEMVARKEPGRPPGGSQARK